MTILHFNKFEREFKRLSYDIQELAKNKTEIFRQDPFDSRLQTHKLHGSFHGFWSFSVNYSYRIIFEFVSADTVRFYSIGNHDIYE